MNDDPTVRPVAPAFAAMRIGFAAICLFLFGPAAPLWLTLSWAILWAADLGNDIAFGIGATQNLGGCLLGIGKWVAWLAMVGAVIF